MKPPTPAKIIADANGAVAFARATRLVNARTTSKGDIARERALRTALDKLRAAMLPLRSCMARFPYGPQTEAARRNRARVKVVSQEIQVERRKLWKMTNR